ncbi:MAG TPA: hypothetical protein VN718_08955 [Rhizomicrobium sp.]|nr:hypothetical protein [Rhizomicrobium sp.]
MRAFCILMGLIISASGLLALLAHPTQVLPNVTWVSGMLLFYWGAFALQRKNRRVFAGRR